MDSEMIERVAKAIRLRDTTDEYAMARAAIKAMREPTENVIRCMDFVHDHDAKKVWQNAIDCITHD